MTPDGVSSCTSEWMDLGFRPCPAGMIGKTRHGATHNESVANGIRDRTVGLTHGHYYTLIVPPVLSKDFSLEQWHDSTMKLDDFVMDDVHAKVHQTACCPVSRIRRSRIRLSNAYSIN